MVRKSEKNSYPKYEPPYPQSFYTFWPKHVIKASTYMLLILAVPLILAFFYQVPTDPNMPPIPDDGMNIPAPEWYLFLLFQPFWYLTGENTKWLSLGTFWIPLFVLVFLLLVPVIFKQRKLVTNRMSFAKKFGLAITLFLLWGAFFGTVTISGRHAKTTGCSSCHNPMMGVRQALPPTDMAEFYRVERARQIEVGQYRIGDQDHMGGSYKDANWQLRHFYEPTMTW